MDTDMIRYLLSDDKKQLRRWSRLLWRLTVPQAQQEGKTTTQMFKIIELSEEAPAQWALCINMDYMVRMKAEAENSPDFETNIKEQYDEQEQQELIAKVRANRRLEARKLIPKRLRKQLLPPSTVKRWKLTDDRPKDTTNKPEARSAVKRKRR